MDWNSITNGLIFGFVLIFIIVGYLFLKGDKNPPKNSSFTPTFTCLIESNFLSIPAGTYCVLTALEDKLSITTATKPQTIYNISYDKLLKFDFTEKFGLDNKTYRQFKPEDIPDRVIVEYLYETDSVQQLRFIQRKNDKNLNRKTLWINNIFDYVNARIQQKNNTDNI